MGKTLIIVGSQFGDEGKGKFSDLLSSQYDYVVRYQGGDNAGHTILFNNQKYKLSLIPSGIFSSKVVIGNGVVLNPFKLVQEIKYLKEKGFETTHRLFVSRMCHIIFDYHIAMDGLLEQLRGDQKIGTTNKGIGPAYSDKAARLGIRASELLNYETLLTKVALTIKPKNMLFKQNGLPELNAEEIAQKYYQVGQEIAPYLIDTVDLLNRAYDKGEKIILEGAQGILLDIDYGTYPFVTSSSIIAAAISGTGLAPQKFQNILGIVKAYSTRVGSGHFLSEIADETLAHQIREAGNEYGTVTRRPRRIGWLDLVSLKYSVQISGINYVALTLLDVLTGLEEIQVCVDYENIDSKIIEKGSFQLFQENPSQYKPIYKTFRGWNQDLTQIKNYDDICFEAKEYIKFIEEFLNVKVAYISVGPNRTQTIIKEQIND
ncbi:adenylosuccinate synthase [Candidatus Mycoplasma pogonae]